MASALLTLSDITLDFGGGPLLDGAALAIAPGARIALVGRNGSGKSTLMKIAAGLVEPDAGERLLDPKATVAYLPQEPDLSAYATLGDYVADGLRARDGEIGDGENGDERHRAERVLGEFDLDPAAAPGPMSGGEKRRAAIARALVGAPDVLLLDEPTNHLDIAAIEALEARLTSIRAAVVLISHDRRLLEAVTNETVWVDRGRTRTLGKGFAAFEGWRDKLLEEEAADRHKLDRKIAMEEDWVRYGVTARRKRNVRRMAELGALRQKKREARGPVGGVAFTANAADASGRQVIVAEQISKAFDGRAVVQHFSIRINRGDRIGFVGPNGAGKTTLLNLLTGGLEADAGAVRLGANLAVARLDQLRQNLEATERVADAITDGRGDWVTIGGEKRHAASYLKDFLFAPEQWRAPVSSLSGGERGRLALAAILAKPSNLLILDEPTNDLDLETLDLLEELLADYAGTLLLVSHDRSFLDRLATSVVAPSLDEAGRTTGRWIEHIGGYADIPARKQPRLAARARSAAPKTPIPRTAPRKLSYKEQFALERLPQQIEALETRIAGAKSTLADPTLFEREPDRFEREAAALAEAEAALAAAEEEWLALEMKREALEG